MVCWRGPVIRGKPCVISAVPKYEEKQEEARQKLWTRENCNFFFPKERFMWAVPGLYLWPKRPRRSCTFTLWKSEWLSVSLQDREWSPGIFSLPWTTLLCHPSWITLLGHSSWVTPPGHPSWATPPGPPLLGYPSWTISPVLPLRGHPSWRAQGRQSGYWSLWGISKSQRKKDVYSKVQFMKTMSSLLTQLLICFPPGR